MPWAGHRASPVEAEQLEPAHQVGGQGHGHHPGGVGLEAGEGKPGEPRVLQSLDVLFDVGVGPHGGVEFDRVPVLVGVEAPVAEVEGGEEAALGSGVQRLPADDAAECHGQLVVVDQRGQLAHRRPVSRSPSWVRAGSQTSSTPMASKMAAVIWAIGAGADEEADVALPTGGQEPLGATRRVGPHDDGSVDHDRDVVTRVVTGGDSAGSWAMAASRTVTWSATVFAPALPGRSIAASISPVGSAKQNIGWKPKPALVGRGGLLLVLGVDVDQRGVDVEDDRVAPVVADERDHTSARTSAMASAMPARRA